MDQRFHVILLGAPGAGKSTQSRLLSTRYPMTVFATGQMLRDEVARGSALGVLADGYFQKGTLLPDDVMIAIMNERLRTVSPRRGILLDGFPRTDLAGRGARSDALRSQPAAHGGHRAWPERRGCAASAGRPSHVRGTG